MLLLLDLKQLQLSGETGDLLLLFFGDEAALLRLDLLGVREPGNLRVVALVEGILLL